MAELKIQIPDTDEYITPGCRIKIGRFSREIWLVSYGWYSYGGNRPICGWYLTDIDDPEVIKPLQLIDLEDCYMIEFEDERFNELDTEPSDGDEVYYQGPYVMKPKLVDQFADTDDKHVREDIVFEKVPVSNEENEAGGETVTIMEEEANE